jgi:hypothetical protein
MLHRILQECRSPYDIDRVLDVVVSMVSRNVSFSEETVSLFVKACCRSDAVQRVLAVFGKPGIYRMRPTRKAAHYTMVKLSLDHNLSGVEQMWQTMEHYGIPITAQTYHVMVRACCDNDNLNQALFYYERSIGQDVKLERGTYNILMKACYDEGSVERLKLMFMLYHQMIGSEIDPNEGTLMLLAQGYVKSGDLEDSLAALCALVKNGDHDKLHENDTAVHNFMSVIASVRSLALKSGNLGHVQLLEAAESSFFSRLPPPGASA